MKPFFTNRYRHIVRYREIVNIISKHGLSQVLGLLGIRTGFSLPWYNKEVDRQTVNTAQRLRTVLQELGPTFIKLGQILSTRPDLLPSAYITELERLQDRVPAVGFEQIKTTLERETGLSLQEVFSQFNEKPLASASIGQVHEAFLLSGEHVVVKVQRAGVERVIQTDLEIMYDAARMLEAKTEWGRYYKIIEMVDEFSRAIREELDYTIEGRNCDRMKSNFRGDTTVYIPKIYWKHSSTRVLIMEHVDGTKITNEKELERQGANRPELARRITNAVFKQLLLDGFFHADPHPGNLAVGKANTVIFFDFGMVGRIDEQMKEQLGMMLLYIVRKDTDGIVRVLIDMGDAHRQIDKPKLKRDINHLFDKYYNRPLKEIKIGQALRELLQLSFVYRIRVPVELVLMIRCLVLLESVVERLDDKVSIVDLAEPFGKKLLREKMVPGQLAKTASNYLFEMSTITTDLPRRIDNLVRTLEEGELKIKLEHRNFRNFVTNFNLVGNRISFSLIIASIIIGSSVIAQKNTNLLFGRLPIAETGFVVALAMGFWLIVSIIRSGRI